MWYLTVVVIVLCTVLAERNDLLQECAKYYRPKNYLDMIHNIKLPYVDELPIPNNQHIRNKEYMNKIQNIAATPVTTTKVLMVKTKYVYKSPMCVKYSKKQKLCKSEDEKHREDISNLITKDYFLKENVEKKVESAIDVMPDDSSQDEADRFSLKVSFNKLEPSEPDEQEESRAFELPSTYRTPSMSPQKVHEMLIEDRLDQLETILPGYRRRRTYETKTMYVTKTISNKRAMATLVVKNCVPVGYDVCPRKQKSRRRVSKVARRTFDSEEDKFYFG